MEKYEDAAFKGHDQSSLHIRSLLGWRSAPQYSNLPASLAAVPELKPTSPPTATHHDECFALVTGYNLIDRWARLTKAADIGRATGVPKTLDNALLDKVKVSRPLDRAKDEYIYLTQHGTAAALGRPE